MRYTMTVTQTLKKEIIVIADTKGEAHEKVEERLINDDFDFMCDNDIEIDTNFKIDRVD